MVTTDGTLRRRLGLADAIVIGCGSMIGAGVFAVWGPAAAAAGTGLLIGLADRRRRRLLQRHLVGTAGRGPPGVRWHVRLRQAAARAGVGPSRRLGLRRRQDGIGGGDGAHGRCLPVAGVRPGGRRRRRRPHRRCQPRRYHAHRRRHARPGCRVGARPARRSSSPAGRRRAPRSGASLRSTRAPSGSSDRRATCSSPSPATPGSRPSARRSAIRRGRSREPSRWPSGWCSRSTPRSPSRCSPSSPSTPSPVPTPRCNWSSRPPAPTAWRSVTRVGAGLASLGVLLNLIPGISRTVLAMARRRELPGVFAAVDARHSLPRRAELAVAAVVVVVIVGDRPARGARTVRGRRAHLLRDHQRRRPDAAAGAPPLASRTRRARPCRLPRPRRHPAGPRHRHRRRRARRRCPRPPPAPPPPAPTGSEPDSGTDVAANSTENRAAAAAASGPEAAGDLRPQVAEGDGAAAHRRVRAERSPLDAHPLDGRHARHLGDQQLRPRRGAASAATSRCTVRRRSIIEMNGSSVRRVVDRRSRNADSWSSVRADSVDGIVGTSSASAAPNTPSLVSVIPGGQSSRATS